MAKDGVRPMRSGPKPPLAGAALRKAVMAIWCVCSVACSGGRSDCFATSPLARSTDCSLAGPGSASGAGCWTGCVRPEGHRGGPHHPGDPQGSMMECPVREPCPPKCCYPDMRRSNPTCEAPGTTALLWKHQSGRGPAEDGRLNASERPWLRSVIENRPKVLTGRGQNGRRVGSSIVAVDDGGTVTRRTTGRNRPIRISTLDNRVSPIRPAARRYPDRKEGG